MYLLVVTTVPVVADDGPVITTGQVEDVARLEVDEPVSLASLNLSHGKKRRENENGASSLGGPRRIRSIVARLAPLLLFGCTMRVAADSHAKDNKPRQTLLFPIGKSTSSTVV